MGDIGFSSVVLGEIERGKRPATMEQLEAISRVLDVSINALLQHAIEWHESIWDGKPKYMLQPGETDARTIMVMSHIEAIDELRGVCSDMRRGVDELHRAEDAMKAAREFDMSSDFRHTADLLSASVLRIETRMGRRMAKAKVDFAPEEDA